MTADAGINGFGLVGRTYPRATPDKDDGAATGAAKDGHAPPGIAPVPRHGTARSGLVPELRAVQAVVLDTDGVITDSARVHAATWKTAFDACLREHPPEDRRQRAPFDLQRDYLRYVDGKSRLDGATSFLMARGVPVPAGAPGDPPGTGTVVAVAALKEQLYSERLRGPGIDAYPGSVRLLNALRSEGIPLAAASASHHARELLTRAGVLHFFAELVDGGEAARLRLPGKPDPALFVEAARRLHVAVARTAVVEDALAGVEAGRRGGFGLVIGVDRAGGPDTGADLLRHGADLVVRDLADLLLPGTED
ncbi:HAD-IA family hydrolase [Streptomyces sp. 21So2-11]|uniref:HAD family hydrolase n=1 Tax=Streptomyces sp. 21So2-11 TaxID=3144408 RepID=UPI0032198816